MHNPNAFQVSVYKKAVRAPLEDTTPVAPGAWKKLDIQPDYAWRIDCDDIAKLLTGNPAATFIGTYGIGVVVEGFVVIAIGPQSVGNVTRYGPLDVTAEYVRGSEVLKKDINYQPWWTWWWWGLPWRLGYPYERIVPIDQASNIDCRGLLYNALAADANAQISDPQQRSITLQALNTGRGLEPTKIPHDQDEHALVALIGGCHKLSTTAASVDFVLVSNRACNDPDPRGVPQSCPITVIRHPWTPGRWYNLPVVMPQNRSIDLDDFIRQWHSQRWNDAGLNAAQVQAAMVYYFPYWCGWHYWWWWGGGRACTDIGVGEGESLDVEQVTPTRVFMPVWPPQ